MAQQLLFILGEPNFDSAEVLLVGPAAGGNSFWDTGTCQMLIRSDPDLVTLITCGISFNPICGSRLRAGLLARKQSGSGGRAGCPQLTLSVFKQRSTVVTVNFFGMGDLLSGPWSCPARTSLRVQILPLHYLPAPPVGYK